MQVLPYIQACLERIDTVLKRYLPQANQTPENLHEAMRYACLTGGKRVRPLLVYAAGHALGIPQEQLDAPAAAVELIHAYSLVHDDLPAMDNDDLRRGQPSCHIAFDDATAILAGDALQALAFEVIANADLIDAKQRTKMLSCLAKSVGSFGMVGGQAIDLTTKNPVNVDQLAHLHRCKTGALIRGSIQLAALTQPIKSETFNQLTLFAETLGLAFQVQDDILDTESDEETQQASYSKLLGITGAQQWLNQLHQEALGILAQMDGDTEYLKHITNFVVERKQ